MTVTRTDETEVTRQHEIMREIKRLSHGKKYLIYTLGCQQNESDSEKLAGMLCTMGYEKTEKPEEADVILFNTCAVRENAEKKLFGRIGACKPLKEKNPSLVLGVCGCMPQQNGMEEHFKRYYRYVDLVFGTHSLYRFPELLKEALAEKRQITSLPDIDGAITEGIPVRREPGVKAYLSVMYGCNNFCTYCIVPYVRGRERSRSFSDVLDEAKAIADEGYREVMLLGQNVNSYRGGLSFAELITRVADVPGIERVRFMSSHPKDLSEELIYAMAENSHICKALHLPVQSGSDRILAAMNRRYTVEHYENLIALARSKMPDITLTTDIIVGFPGETAEDFEKTMQLLARVRYDSIFSFIYSRRRGTPAAEMEDVMTEEEKHKNFDAMIELQNGISLEKNRALIGSVQKVLVEGRSKSEPAKLSGRSDGGKLVHFESGEDLTGEFVPVRIREVNTFNLIGEKEG